MDERVRKMEFYDMDEFIHPPGQNAIGCAGKGNGLGAKKTELLVLVSLLNSLGQCSMYFPFWGSSFITFKMEGCEIWSLIPIIAVSDAKTFKLLLDNLFWSIHASAPFINSLLPLYLYTFWAFHWIVIDLQLLSIKLSRKWQPTPGFLTGKLYGQRSLAMGLQKLDMTEQSTHTSIKYQ